MPRSRGSDGAVPPHHRASPRAPLHLRAASNNTATSADSNGTRPIRDRSPKLEEHRRSPRSPLPEVGVTTAQKKRATRVADLETRLGHAQEELRKLREQLASAEAAKKDAQHELQETKKKKKKNTSIVAAAAAASGTTGKKDKGESDQSGSCAVASVEMEEKKKPEDGEDKDKEHKEDLHEEKREQELQVAADAEEKEEQPTAPAPVEESGGSDDTKVEAVKESGDGTVVADVTTAHNALKEEVEEQTIVKEQEEVVEKQCGGTMEEQTNEEHATTTTVITTDQQEDVCPQSPDLTKKPASAAAPEEEMLELETRLWKKDKELDLMRSENASLKSQLAESAAEVSSLTAKLSSLESSLVDQRQAAEVKVGEAESARAALEAEVKLLRVQTEQWRKAADAAAAIISGEEFDGTGVLGGRKVAERCGSMDKYIGGFDAAAVFGSPLTEADGDGAVTAKRRGIRAFGDLWKKKGPSAGNK